MKRPVLIVTIGLIIGIIWGLYFNITSFILCLLSVYFIYILLKLFYCPKHNKSFIRKIIRIISVFINRKIISLFIIFALIGYFYIYYLEKDYKNIYSLSGSIKIIGTIISEKTEKEYSYQYVISVESINNKKAQKKFFLTTNKKEIKYGNKIKLTAEYIKPEIQRNYMGFDYSKYLKSKKIYGTLKLKDDIEIIKESNVNILEKIANGLRYKIINNFKNVLSNKVQSVFFGILLGYTNDIEQDVKDDFSNSSLSHLLAVSGAHVAYVILCIKLITGLLKISNNTNKIVMSLVLIMYLYLIGFTPSVTRAVIMVIIAINQSLFYKKQDIATTISISALYILVSNPYSIYNIGFLLSFAGTIGIILFNKIIQTNNKNIIIETNNIRNKIIKYIQNTCIVTISAQIMILPIMLYYFNKISLIFIISNLVAGILIGPIIVIGLILIMLSFINMNITSIISRGYSILLELLINFTRIVGKLPISKIYVKTPNMITIFLYYTIIIVIILIYRMKASNNKYIRCKTLKYSYGITNYLKIKKKLILISIIILVFTNCIIKTIPSDLKIYFIDVGQGDSTLIITPDKKTILIDSGGNEKYDVGRNVLLPYLLDRGITKLDYIMVSHFDTDHCKGFEYILENIKVRNIIISKQNQLTKNYKKINELCIKHKVKKIVASKRDVLCIGKYSTINIYSPDKVLADDINDNSIVAKFKCYRNTILFTGDASTNIEEKLLNDKNINLKSNILKVSHHGSRTGTSEEFLNKVNPEIVLIGVGENNKFGHPHDEVINRIKNKRKKIFRTDKNGEISIKINENGQINLNTKIK